MSEWVVTCDAEQAKKDQVLTEAEVKVSLLLLEIQGNVCSVKCVGLI